MSPSRRLALLGSCFLLALAGCDRATPGDVTPGAPDAPAAGAPSAAAGAEAECPETGRWAPCSVEQRLEDAGLVPKPVDDDPSRRDGFSVPGIRYTLGRSRLELFLYADAAAASRDLAALDTVRAAPPGELGDWGGPPRLMRSGNLLAVLVTLNARQAERVWLALTAGPPQPPAP